jgi:polyisoprenyl-teichoic acid--peptidoglycan teichoic acid transferase
VKLIPHSRGGSFLRFALGAVIVIAFTATTTAVAGLLQVKQLTQEIGLTPPIKHANIVIADPGQPQTILVIGSDHRAGTPFSSSNTDTMMLIRLDPDSQTINVMSVPRDLRVQLPQGGTTFTSRINATYSVGGPNLLIKVLKTQVFPGLKVNHIIDVNFGGFSDLVDAIGCVYTDVDHRYYNNTAYTGYSSIDIKPGYQKLCGDNQAPTGALAFVRFRHTDSDLVRNARQQDFIRWAKDQYGASRLIANRDKLLRIFGAHAQTDHNLHTTDGLINLFDLLAFSAGHAINQIKFPAILLPCSGGGGVVPGTTHFVATSACYVTADAAAEKTAFAAFMRPTQKVKAATTAPAATAKPKHHKTGGSTKTPGLIEDVTDGTAQIAALGHHVGMSLYYPKLIEAGTQYCVAGTGVCPVEISAPNTYPRSYTIHDQRGRPYAAYRITLVKNAVLGEYYGVQGTTWQHPPILDHPTQTETVNGKQLLEYFDGQKLTLVAWKTPKGVYWVSNTLTSDIPNRQLVGIAASLTRT